MASTEADKKSCLKIVKIISAISSRRWRTPFFYSEEDIFRRFHGMERILKEEGNINYTLPSTLLLKTCAPDWIGCTILHIQSYFGADNQHILNELFNHGADVTMKSPKGRTIVHDFIYANAHVDPEEVDRLSLVKDKDISTLLLAHMRLQIAENPVDLNGLSHFHAACMTDNVKAMKFFLDNGVPIDQRVNVDSPAFPGYTAMHFAARFGCVEAVKFLVLRRANVHAQDASSMTPLHLIVSRALQEERSSSYYLPKSIQIIEGIAENCKDHNVQDNFGFTGLHVLCISKDSSKLKRHLNEFQDVNCAVSVNSPICPGYTPLHLAVKFNLDSLKLLLSKGADITIKDAEQNTPLDLYIAKPKNSIEDVHDVLCRSAFKSTTLADGKTRLTDLVFSMRDLHHFNIFLRELDYASASIPVVSTLWPGYTPLHLAIVLQGCHQKKIFEELIESCINNGADINARSGGGQTPLQFAFRRGHMVAVELLLKHHQGTSNPVDEDSLSHLQIACAAENLGLVEAFLRDGADVNCKLDSTFKFTDSRVVLWAGSTPLHIAVATKNVDMAKLLLEHGADMQARDASGRSAIHRLMISEEYYEYEELCHVLLSSSECVADDCGLSQLHVACYLNDASTVERYLRDPKVQVNRVVHYKASDGYTWYQLQKFDGRTPLQVAMHSKHSIDSRNNFQVIKSLLDHGADILAGDGRFVPLYKLMNDFWYYKHDQFLMSYLIANDCSDLRRLFIATIKSDENLSRRIERVSGLTNLHLACCGHDEQWVIDLLAEGADVNARTRDDSTFWPGCTPLHCLIKAGLENADEPDKILQLLLDNGADVATPASDDLNTPLHFVQRWCFSMAWCKEPLSREPEGYDESIKAPKLTLPDIPCDRASLMLRSIKDFSTNPTNAVGVSHFHIACWCLDDVVVEKFLKHGVDANLRIDYFYNRIGGYTPLHVTVIREATSPRKMKIVELLLKYGADVHAENFCGNTPLHCAAMSYVNVGLPIFTKIFDAGADINAKNVLGASPIQILLKKGEIGIKKMKYFIARGCRINDFNAASDEGLIPMIFAAHKNKKQDIKTILLNSLVVGELDEMGRSAIHNIASTYSPTFERQDYIELIEELEKLGCDVDHQDNSGQTALHVAARFRNDRAIFALLAAGADINSIDGIGETAFAYSLAYRRVPSEECSRTFVGGCKRVDVQLFLDHVNKLRLAGLHVIGQNLHLRSQIPFTGLFVLSSITSRFQVMLDSKVSASPKSLTFRQFISENGPMRKYSQMRQMTRPDVVELFDTILNKPNDKLDEIRDLVKLQYRKYLARPRLIEDAKVALNAMANILIPDNCSKFILDYCANWELKNVTMAAN